MRRTRLRIQKHLIDLNLSWGLNNSRVALIPDFWKAIFSTLDAVGPYHTICWWSTRILTTKHFHWCSWFLWENSTTCRFWGCDLCTWTSSRFWNAHIIMISNRMSNRISFIRSLLKAHIVWRYQNSIIKIKSMLLWMIWRNRLLIDFHWRRIVHTIFFPKPAPRVCCNLGILILYRTSILLNWFRFPISNLLRRALWSRSTFNHLLNLCCLVKVCAIIIFIIIIFCACCSNQILDTGLVNRLLVHYYQIGFKIIWF